LQRYFQHFPQICGKSIWLELLLHIPALCFSLLNQVFPASKGGVHPEIAQLFKCTPLFQPFIILDLYLQHMESLTEIVRRQAIVRPPSCTGGPLALAEGFFLTNGTSVTQFNQRRHFKEANKLTFLGPVLGRVELDQSRRDWAGTQVFAVRE